MLEINVENFLMNIQLGNITDDMVKKVKDMPVYTDNEFIQLINDVAIIKLGN